MIRVALIDGNHMVRRAHHVTPNLTDGDGNPTGGLFGFLASLGDTLKKFRPDMTLVLWDGGNDAWRKKLLPDYKNRKEKNPEKEKERKQHAESVNWQVKRLHEEILPLLGVPTVRVPGSEADDLIYLAAHQVLLEKLPDGVRCLVVSGDRDLYQMVGPRISVYDPMKKGGPGKGLLVKEENFAEATGWKSPKQFLQYRLLAGDSSDRIPGVGGVKEKTAQKLFDVYPDLVLALRDLEGVQKLGKKIAGAFSPENLEVIKRNRLLMALDKRTPHPEEIQAIRVGIRTAPRKVDLDRVQGLVEAMGSISFAAAILEWGLPFREMMKKFRSIDPKTW